MISRLARALLRPTQLRSSGVIMDSVASVIGALPLFLLRRFHRWKGSTTRAKLRRCFGRGWARYAVEEENLIQMRRERELSTCSRPAALPFLRIPWRAHRLRSH